MRTSDGEHPGFYRSWDNIPLDVGVNSIQAIHLSNEGLLPVFTVVIRKLNKLCHILLLDLISHLASTAQACGFEET